MKQAATLLPCPFCGQQPRFQQVWVNLFGPAQWEVRCQRGAESPSFPVKARAVRWWSRRDRLGWSRREWVLPTRCNKR